MGRYGRYQVRCACGRTTNTRYARANGGKCKSCVTGVDQPSKAARLRPRGYDPDYDAMMDDRDVYSHMSARDLEMNDRLDYANAVAASGDPERAAEIRMGA